MNTSKIQQKIIAQHKRGAGITVGEYEGLIGVSWDGGHMYFIAPEDFMLDMDKLLAGRTKFNLETITRHLRDAESAYKTSEAKQVECGLVVKIKNEQTETWVPLKQLELFAKDCSFKITKPLAPVWVFENDTLVGLIMPVRTEPKGE